MIGAAAERVVLQAVDKLAVTVLVDNYVDALLPTEGPARRPARGATTIPASLLDGGRQGDALRAEHGFSALVTLSRGGSRHSLLFDAGLSQDGLTHNLRRLELAPADIEAVVLSHGHVDHTAGLHGLLGSLRQDLPLVIHPDAWLRRRLAVPGADPIELPPLSMRSLHEAGFEVLERRTPSLVFDSALLVTGEVDRETDFERGFPIHQALRGRDWSADPLIADDQALVADVRGLGLVVITGCGHAGIVNTVRHALRATGATRVHAILGGFHLTGPLFEPLIPRVCRELATIAPAVLVPMHCSGWRATQALAAQLPTAFSRSSVGTRFEFNANATADRDAHGVLAGAGRS